MMKIDFLRLIANLKTKPILPIGFKMIFKTNFLEWNSSAMLAIGRCEGVATISIFEGKETGRRWFCREKFKIILRSESEKRFWQGDVALIITATSLLSCCELRSELDFDIAFATAPVGIKIDIMRFQIDFVLVHEPFQMVGFDVFAAKAIELFWGAYPDIFWQRQLTYSAKAECEVVSSWW